MSLLTREVMRRSNHEGKTSGAQEKKTRGEISFWPICLCGRGNHKIDHCVIGHSYIIYQFSNTSEINKKRKGRRQHIT